MQLIKDYGIPTPIIISPVAGSTLYVGSIQAISSSAYPVTSAGIQVSSNWRITNGSTTVWLDSNDTSNLISLDLNPTTLMPGNLFLQVQYTGQSSISSSWSPAVNLKLEYCTPSTPTMSTTIFNVTWGAWSTWMNTYAVWVGQSTDTNNLAGAYISVQEPLVISTGATYTFYYLSDNAMSIVVDSSILANTLPNSGNFNACIFNSATPCSISTYLSAGTHQLNITGYNTPNGATLWTSNPAGFATIVKDSANNIVFNLRSLVGTTSYYCPNGTYSTLDGMCHCYSVIN